MTKHAGEKIRMRIGIGERDKYGDEILYEALVRLFRKEGFAAVDNREKIDRVMPRIDEMMSGGMITLETTTVLRYARKHA